MSSLFLPLSYERVSLAAAVLCIALFAVLMLDPSLITWLFGIDGNATSDFMSRRAAILFLGLAAIAFLSRQEPESSLRRSVASGLFITMAGLLCLGLFELLRGTAGLGILIAVLGEALFAILYLPFCRERAVKDSHTPTPPA